MKSGYTPTPLMMRSTTPPFDLREGWKSACEMRVRSLTSPTRIIRCCWMIEGVMPAEERRVLSFDSVRTTGCSGLAFARIEERRTYEQCNCGLLVKLGREPLKRSRRLLLERGLLVW